MDSGYMISVDDNVMYVLDNNHNMVLSLDMDLVPDIVADMMTVYLREDRARASERSERCDVSPCDEDDCSQCNELQTHRVAKSCPRCKRT